MMGDREQFLKSLAQQVRAKGARVWKEAFPKVRERSGGRPSLRPLVFDACQTFWDTNPKNLTLGILVKKVEELLAESHVFMSKDTLVKHTKAWMGELDIGEMAARFSGTSYYSKQAREALVAGKVFSAIIAPWAKTRGLKTMGQILEIEKRGFPRSLQRKIMDYKNSLSS